MKGCEGGSVQQLLEIDEPFLPYQGDVLLYDMHDMLPYTLTCNLFYILELVAKALSLGKIPPTVSVLVHYIE